MIIEGGLNRESFAHASYVHRSQRQASINTGIHQAQSLAIERNEVCSCGVSRLHGWSRPDAIVFRITKIVVFPIKAMAFTWAWTHISEKIRKLFPSLVNRNAASSIMLVHSMLRVGSPRDHSLPCRVLRGPSRASTVAMLLGRFISQATTRLRVSTSKLSDCSRGLLAARTFTNPMNAFRFQAHTLKRCQPSKDLPRYVCRTGAKRIVLSASAGFRMARRQLSAIYKRYVAAYALTFPHAFPVGGVTPTTNYSQIMRPFSDQFEGFHKRKYIAWQS